MTRGEPRSGSSETDGGPARTGAIEAGVRRVPELDPAAAVPESNPELVGRIRAEIERDGPMPFARFMELALYEPEGGYYTRSGADDAEGSDGGGAIPGPGRRGDFLTSPEGHPIFGWAIAAHVESVWDALGRPARFVVREHGAGTGALAAAILDGLRRSGSELEGVIRYQALDAAPARVQELRLRLAGAGLDAPLEAATDRPEAAVILANELLDALPVHRVEGGANGEVLERFVQVGSEGELRETTGAASTPALRERLEAEGIRLAPGQVAEVCLALDGWVQTAATTLERGELLLVDYGHPAAALYDPARGSTLRAYTRHRVHADPFVAIGRQDLTAHVDLTAVDRAARAAGLEPTGSTTQARFLADLGIGDLLVGLQQEPGTTLQSYLAAKSALVRMLDPRATGAFAALGFGKGLPPDAPLRGFGAAR